MTTNTPADSRWLRPLPIRWDGTQFHLEPRNQPPTSIQQTFEQIVNQAQRPRWCIEPRIPEVRRALCSALRSTHHPEHAGHSLWTPTADCYRPFQSTIGPLLNHPLWRSHAVRAAPYLVYLPRNPIAGVIDAIVEHPKGDIGIVAIHTCPRDELRVAAARAELGGFIAALADHQVVYVDHAITVWASPHNTEIEYHHPDICLGHWIDAVDLAQCINKLNSTQANAAGDHPSADPAGIH